MSSRNRVFRRLLPSLLVLPLLALGARSPTQAATGAGAQPESSLWAGGQRSVARLPLEPARSATGETLRLPQSSGVRALAVDASRERALTLHDDAIRVWESDGTAAGGWSLEPLDEEAATTAAAKREPRFRRSGLLRVVEGDGSVWVARGHRLEAFGEAGQRFSDLRLPAPLVGLEVDEESGVLWTATARTVEARDLLTGEVLGPLPVEASGITALALSPAGDLWVAAAGQLLRFDPAGEQVLRVALDDPIDGLVARGRGLWARSGATLLALGADGERLLETRPLDARHPDARQRDDEAQITALAAAGGQVWISDGRRVLRLALDGSVLSEDSVAGEAGITSLAPWLITGQDEPPGLEIDYPNEGERVRGQRPVVHLLWSDDEGVDPATVALTVGGVPLSIRCDEELEGASCSLLEDLPLGPVTVTATVADLSGQSSVPEVRSFLVAEPPPPAEVEETVDENAIPYSSLATPRGVRPNTAFLSPTDVESIDTASGNVTLRVPLGPSYSVGPLISYQLQVVNNSNAWDHIPAFCPPSGCPEPLLPITVSMPNPQSNAGLGWEIHFGRLYSPTPPTGFPSSWDRQRWPNLASQADPADQGTRWMYVAPDGAVHYLFALPGRPAGFYTKDGTFLRLRTVGSNTMELDFPDGRTSVFELTNSSLGTNFCGGGVNGCWRFKEMKDPYGNKLWVTYQALGGTEEQWTVFDSVRSTTALAHKLIFDVTPAGTGRGDGHPNGVLTRPNGDEWGDTVRVLERVETAGFEGQRAHFLFDTAPTQVNRGCPFDERHELDTVDATIRTPVLERIRVVDGTTGAALTQPWTFSTLTGNGGSSCDRTSGRVSDVTAPSRGSIHYDYGFWRQPTRCVYTRPTDPDVLDEIDFDQLGTGLALRKVKDAAGGLVGTWSYTSQLYPTIQEMIAALPAGVPHTEDSILYGQYCRRQEYRRTVVKEPVVNGKYKRTEHYSSTAEGERRPSAATPILEPQATDRGLPFTKSIFVNSSNGTYRFLSERISECPASGGACVPKRKRFVRYATEFRGECDKVLGDSPECYQVNPAMLVERTLFLDDGSKYVEQEHRQPDGAGHFRTTLLKDTYDGPVHTRTETTAYTATGSTVLSIDSTTGYVNPGTPSSYLPAPSARWVLHPFDEKTVTDDGRTYRQLFQFNAEGSLTCSRKRKVAGASSGQDVVVQQILGSSVGTDAGLPVTEIVAGGDGANLGTALCSTAASGPGTRFQIDHTYQHSVLSKTQIGNFPTWYQAVIDEASGLPKKTFNTSGQFTAYAFDPLGRLTGIFPSASLRQADTRITYQNEATSDLKVITQRRVGQGPVLTRAETFYDFLARPYRDVLERPTPGGTAETEVKTLYDAVGRVSRITTRQPKNAVDINKATFYADYDVFGRPRRITRPDGQLERLTYQGERYVQSQVDVMTPSGLSSSARTTIRDALGRVVQVGNPVFSTNTSYDPYGRVLNAQRIGGGQSQTRSYGQDGRGFLLWENLPEVDGAVSYQHNAFGQVTRSQGPRDLTYAYDGAARRLRVEETATGRLWNEWEWSTANGVAANQAGDYSLGKIRRAVRYNYPLGSPWAVVEEYQYGGEGSQVSRKTTFFHWPDQGLDGARFFQDYDYDDLGNRTAVVYPRCETVGGINYCNGSNDQPGPLHTVTTSFDRGMPVSTQSSLGPGASYTYHPNLQLASMTYSNGVLGTFDQGTNGLPRPRRLRFTLGGGSLFDSGLYEYDGAGNVYAIGSESYVYDKADRLLRGDVPRAGLGAWEAYTYDAFDNVLTLDGDSVASTSYNVSSQTNRLLGNDDITYDAAGNMTGVATIGSPPQPLYEMAYDALDMQAEFTSRNPQTPSHRLYVYGPGNYRFADFDQAAMNPVRVVALRDLDGKILSEYEVSGFGSGANGEQWVHQKDFIYGPGGLLATRTRTGETRFFHADHLGSPRAITSNTGGLIGRHDYYPFGRELARSGQADEPKVKFTGHERDSHGLSDYMLGRYYLHPFQRFSSVDPARDGWNLYGYAGENPIKYSDPTGLTIFLKAHEVALGLYHTSIVIVPDNQEAYQEDDRFMTTDEGGRFATLGAGPENRGRLVSNANRPADADLDTAAELLEIDLGGRNEDEVIAELFAADAAYPDNLDYDLLPKSPAARLFWVPDDGYNSNSYAHGLLNSIHLVAPQPSEKVPGFDKPVPPQYFRKLNH